MHHIGTKRGFHQDFIMNPFESNVAHDSVDLCLLLIHNVQILRTEHDLDLFVFFKTFIHTFKTEAVKFHQVIPDHDSFYDIGFSDEACNKTVLRFIVNICGSADLLDLSVVHNNHRIRHG